MPKQLENWEKEFIRNWIAIKDFSQDDMLKYIRDQRQEAAKEIQERDRKSLEARNQPKEIKEKIIEILDKNVNSYPKGLSPLFQGLVADQILALLKEEIKKETEWQCEQTLKRCQRWCEEEKEEEKQKWAEEIKTLMKERLTRKEIIEQFKQKLT